MLREAEGLRTQDLPAYTALLYAWAAVALAALAFETPTRARRWAVPGFVTAMGLRASAEAHFRWIREQASINPKWWNRAMRSDHPPGPR